MTKDLPPDFVASGTYRRGGLSVYGKVEPARTALLALNLQNAWLAHDAPFRLSHDEAADRVLGAVNDLAAHIRDGGGQVIWLRTTTGAPGAADYWATYFENFVGADKRQAASAALTPGGRMHTLSPDARVAPADLVLDKRRFSPFLRNDYDLEATLRARGIDAVIVVGTATNICCESTVRDAMMRDFRTYMPHDAVWAPRADGHLAGLRSVMQAFADIRPVADILAG
jgi:ureidoacrylate peracid hydrolase